ncbi:hypothetical protein [Jannaschia sp. LMIT008]|uniref:hypothetical protein n=1 Tax=Jannaschia maritima TaxID=3032585 RepID=UPI002811E986|nr:hypothetical protein [Jannaschia sp. LMIT008]
MDRYIYSVYRNLGHSIDEADSLAARRGEKTGDAFRRLLSVPFIGSVTGIDGMRCVQMDDIALYFRPEPDRGVIEILGIFHPSSDHRARMARRRGGGPEG